MLLDYELNELVQKGEKSMYDSTSVEIEETERFNESQLESYLNRSLSTYFICNSY